LSAGSLRFFFLHRRCVRAGLALRKAKAVRADPRSLVAMRRECAWSKHRPADAFAESSSYMSPRRRSRALKRVRTSRHRCTAVSRQSSTTPLLRGPNGARSARLSALYSSP
jgi:hypothetical protein